MQSSSSLGKALKQEKLNSITVVFCIQHFHMDDNALCVAIVFDFSRGEPLNSNRYRRQPPGEVGNSGYGKILFKIIGTRFVSC